MIVQRLYSFLVVFLLMFLGTSLGQSSIGQFSASTPSQTARYNKFTPSELHYFVNKKSFLNTPEKNLKNFSLNMVPASFYTSQLGIVCRTELQLDKLSPVPLRLRLGSLAYVNYLEQKPNALNVQR